MDISPSQKANEEFNSYLNFIRPVNDNDNNRSRLIREPLQITTDPLGISFTPSTNQNSNNDNDNDDIFKQLNFPHMKRSLYSPSSECSSAASSPQLKPTASNNTCYLSPIMVAASVAPSPKKMVELSPAASFLASFMSPSCNNGNQFNSNSNNTILAPSLQQQSSEENQDIITDDYNVGDTIGFGGFSTVRKAQHKKTNEIVAVKIINQHLMSDVDKIRLDRELSIWKSLNHPRIIQLRKVIKSDQSCNLICDYCSEGNLLGYLNTVKKLNEQEAKKIFKEICQGVYYLHIDRKVCHKDLKLENILMDNQGYIKICDFGLAIYQQQHHHHYHQSKKNKRQEEHEEVAGGSLAYASPEQIRQVTPLTCPKTDIWSLGVILYALVVGSLPFMDTYDLRLQQKILEGQYDIPTNELSQPLQELIHNCLEYDPHKRFSIDQVLNSSWLKGNGNNE